MGRKLVILGGHGDGEVVAASVRAGVMVGLGGTWELAGFLNDGVGKGELIAGCPVLGGLEDWTVLPPDYFFIAALHKVRQMRMRAERIESLNIPDSRWGIVADPAARIAGDCRIGEGAYIGPNVVIQPGVQLGRHVSIRAGANLGHDAVIGDYCYVGPNATLCGRSEMHTGAHLAPNSCVADGVRIGQFAVVGIVSAVTKHVPADTVVFGVPAIPVFA